MASDQWLLRVFARGTQSRPTFRDLRGVAAWWVRDDASRRRPRRVQALASLGRRHPRPAPTPNGRDRVHTPGPPRRQRPTRCVCHCRAREPRRSVETARSKRGPIAPDRTQRRRERVGVTPNANPAYVQSGSSRTVEERHASRREHSLWSVFDALHRPRGPPVQSRGRWRRRTPRRQVASTGTGPGSPAGRGRPRRAAPNAITQRASCGLPRADDGESSGDEPGFGKGRPTGAGSCFALGAARGRMDEQATPRLPTNLRENDRKPQSRNRGVGGTYRPSRGRAPSRAPEASQRRTQACRASTAASSSRPADRRCATYRRRAAATGGRRPRRASPCRSSRM